MLFYPGARLSDEGLPNIDGPLSCLRMKAYRRGLQDYEYGWLLKQAGKESVADEIVKRVIPVALSASHVAFASMRQEPQCWAKALGSPRQ